MNELLNTLGDITSAEGENLEQLAEVFSPIPLLLSFKLSS